ncbi:hypothetical protein V6N11_009205 [Hibiscus sabdariffa]|uniref:Uncharacterized protein n=1 Tax=Hibiscus sabdariffa TaxID=183260 RepID=A0ABR2PPX4_9ROSI
MVNTSEVLDANGVVAQGCDDASQMFSNKRIKVQNNESQGQTGLVQSTGSQNRGRPYKNAASTEGSEPVQGQASVEAKVNSLTTSGESFGSHWWYPDSGATHHVTNWFTSAKQSSPNMFESEPVPVIPSYQASLDVDLSQGHMQTRVQSSPREPTSAASSADPITSGATAGSGSFPIMTDSGFDGREEGLTAGGVVNNEAEVPVIGVDDETVDGAVVHNDEDVVHNDEAAVYNDEAAVHNDEAAVYNDEIGEEAGASNAKLPVDEIPDVDMAAEAANTTAEETRIISTTADSGSTLVRNTHTMLTRNSVFSFSQCY